MQTDVYDENHVHEQIVVFGNILMFKKCEIGSLAVKMYTIQYKNEKKSPHWEILLVQTVFHPSKIPCMEGLKV